MNTAAAVQEGDFQPCMLRLTLFIVLWSGIQTSVGRLGYELRQSRSSRGVSLFLTAVPHKYTVGYLIS